MGSPLNPKARKVGSRQGARRIDEAVQTALRQSSRAGLKPTKLEWGDKEVTVVATRLDQVTQKEITETVARVLRELGKDA